MHEAFNLFKQMIHKDIVTWNSMITGYAQVGEMEKAVKMFEEMGKRNLVYWNALSSGFTQNGLYVDALESFAMMRKDGFKPDQSTFASGLSACGSLAALQRSQQFHQIVNKSGYAKDSFVSNELITAYAKCGISCAEILFYAIDNVDVISWNPLIAGYALNGRGKDAVDLFKDMETKGATPDQVTFVGVLSACSHAGGFIDQGLELFDCRTKRYFIEPLSEHYACMVDLLGRAGRLKEAFNLMKGMKIMANAGVWGALLGACHIH